RALVGVGGDGTIAELANRTQAGVPLTILPNGNENLLARHLGLRRSADALCETIAAGRMVRLDAGRAAGRLFLLMIGCGFDAEVVRRFQQRRTGHIGHHSYIRPILESLVHYEYGKILIYCDEINEPLPEEEKGGRARFVQSTLRAVPANRAGPPFSEARWLFAFNLPCYAGGLPFAPDADGTDGQLDVCTFRRGSMWHGLRYFFALARRRHMRLNDCRTFRATRLRIEAEGRVPYQLDGDFAGFLPVEVETVPGRLTLLVPPNPS
ncbi:MAG TPA: diacylglycerol kinase family protein, partial [Thermoguttaceae bacterium]|nr:diacylglycerol kinase family protein [Thermoguttaceae bacterium]